MKRLRVLLSALFFLSTVGVSFAMLSTMDCDTAEAQEQDEVTEELGQSRRPRRPRRRRRRRPTSFAGFRTGLILTAPGNLTINDNETRFEEESTFGINGLAVFPFQNNIRGGVSLWLFPGYEANAQGENADRDGTMIQLNAIGEFVLPVSEVEGFAYAEAGLALVLPGDDDTTDYLGFNGALGVGAQFMVNREIAIRADGSFGFYTVSNNDDNEESLAAQRVMLNIGVMFGL